MSDNVHACHDDKKDCGTCPWLYDDCDDGKKPTTNFERFKAEMTVESLAAAIVRINGCGRCPANKYCNSPEGETKDNCKETVEGWLSQEAE